MLLSRCVGLLNQLSAFDFDQAQRGADQTIESLLSELGCYQHECPADHLDKLRSARSDIQKAYQGLHQELEQFREALLSKISELEQQYLASSTRWYHNESVHETTQYRLQRSLAMDPQSQELLTGHLLRAGDWRYPGLVIGPGLSPWIQHLVGLDPLYLADVSEDLLAPVLGSFGPEYRNRVRPYIVCESQTQGLLSTLPQGQMSWVFAWNFFNYRPIEVLYQYLLEIKKLMRPGGSFMFTFNDCDRAHGVALVEQNNYQCYTPGRTVIQLANALGWQVRERHQGVNDCAWLVLTVPGELSSQRGAQCLAKIVAKSK